MVPQHLTLKAIEDKIFPKLFVRIHKSYLVSIFKIGSISAIEVNLDKLSLPVSRNYRAEILKKIDSLLLKR